MKARVSTYIVAAGVVALIGFGAGCGDNSNNDNVSRPGATRTATPARTPTPVASSTTAAAPTPTATPIGGSGTATVTFTANSSAGIQGFDIRVTYPTAKGGFRGSADSVDCTSQAPAFTKNDKDDGNMTLISASASNLTFPITITCTFDETQTITASDITATVNEVTQNGAPGDKTQLTVDVTVTQQ